MKSGFFLSLFFNPKVGGDMFLRNVGGLSMDYTALYPAAVRTSNPMFKFLHKFLSKSKKCEPFQCH
jgi:hypothetical protein